MTTEARPQVVGSFLTQLEAALVGVPGEVRREIIAGVTEELAGLDAVTAVARIEELGDPAFIAAEARAGIPPVAAASVVPASPVVPAPAAVGEPRWYVVLIALLVAFGGCVVPVLGWIVGIVMMWRSKSWFGWEKWVATLFVPIAVVLAALIMTFALPGSGGRDQSGAELINPLLPPSADVVWSSIVFAVIGNAAVGAWLLWRGLRPDPGRFTRRER